MFEKITAAPADPILGLTDIFRADDRAHKINLGIGVYKDETGKTPVLTSVKKAEQYLLENEATKNYLGIDGLPVFASCTQELLFGANSAIIADKRARTAQTPGGTGGLRIAADFIAHQTSAKRVWVSNPSWPNHKNVFEAAGLEVVEYAYYDATNHALDFDGLLNSLSEAQAGDVVLFHGCCHNPTGIDPTEAQWSQLAELSVAKGWLPLFDFAYQGFAKGLEEDAQGLRIFAATHQELIVCSSYSKNFGLYNERVGACTLVAADSNVADTAFSQVKAVIRANYSNPPAHGASVVATILSNAALRAIWEQELTDMRQRIQRMRQLFVNTLQEKGAQQDFSFIINQNGMFSFSGLTKEQVLRLRDEFAVYAVNSGRVNVAGMTPDNMAPLCEAIVAVL
ncbi:aromatic amino acid aminotransferase [Yersinia pseudotuberculosis]|uniref:Aminotransferase n=1 Tax=Yersinia wautersii TaxID=1341643 RepID=A0ABP1ZCL0_9GAMM|nr:MULTISPECIES: amino acid aminotransferase [Yersinia pseudotuberculosis complex]AJK16318.1 aspartate aminotransferase [Yersinia pseudotuberculosis str. PA3606]MBO1550201.1 aminotransferase class I/II-fold pyridoxal phosphate-dependent enzyme [Yersinia pseudotuberculosis]MBO1570327.1 aminotransferase class I/II-fold pyridoxal phosphate-dependent enzyme [Yersinia pseudotuberculosis]MBO1585325.1 aminotransferase class I/II-fold pyridoxal phosphate-dependent enzyme [Yersinia pseudotuberculosis]M